MNIYVAGKTDDWERVRRIQEACVRLGHCITFDWTRTVEEFGADAGLVTEDESDDQFRKDCAVADVKGVHEADMLIVCADYPGLCGTLIEVGIAIALEMPIVMIGEPERNSVFFALDCFTRLSSEFELMDHLPVTA